MNHIPEATDRTERNRSFGHGRDSFAPLGPACTRVAVKLPMAPGELEKLAGLLENRPDVTLHFHTAPSKDLEFLKFFPGVRRLSVHLWSLENIHGFSYVAGRLEHLSFGRTQKRFSLKFLQDMPALKALSLEGHSKDMCSIGHLARLTSLALRSITLPDLSALAPLRELTSLGLLLGGTRNLAQLAELPKLQALDLLRINRLEDLSILAKLASLQKLGLDSMRNVTALPNLACLAHLNEVSLETMKGLTELTAVAAAPNLLRLTIAGMPQLEVDAFRCLAGHPTLQELRLWSSLEGAVNLKKSVRDAVMQLLPGITAA